MPKIAGLLKTDQHSQRDLILIPSDVPADKIPSGIRSAGDMDFFGYKSSSLKISFSFSLKKSQDSSFCETV